ncbi:DUF2147 domain-containing protein [Fluviibacterium sp. DFM31]|uniref:DUF2147 domain-containing protein n=1 Tax=Meridianimarinicoccus marinus TaxID=3231483 RepID=A0ABV3L3G6_9RHOB
MKTLVLAAALTALGTAACADPVLGTWKTQPGDDGVYGYVELSPCEGKVCGVLVQAFDAGGGSRSSAALGKRMVWDMVAHGGGRYGKGKIWAPDRDKTYASKMALEGDTLEVSGCVIGICRTQVWTRVP